MRRASPIRAWAWASTSVEGSSRSTAAGSGWSQRRAAAAPSAWLCRPPTSLPIPMLRAPSRAGTPEPPRRQPPMPDIRVLIVDDEPDIRATVSAMLEIEGYDVDEASNGADALHAVE